MKIRSLFFVVFYVITIISCSTENVETILETEPINEIPADAIFVTNASELNAAIDAAAGGEVIILRDGNYGNLKISSIFPENIVIRSEHNLAAIIGKLDIERTSHIEIDGLTILENIEGSHSNYNTIRNSKLSAAIFKFSENIIFTNNDLKYANFNDSSYFEITVNYFHHASADLLHTKGNAHHFLIENNVLYDTVPDADAHSDAIQMAGNTNGNPHDFVLRGNYLYDDPTTDVANGKIKKLQGFFLADATGSGYYNVLIEDNVINVSNTSNSIAVLGVGENVTIKNNTLLPTALDSGGGIRVTQHEGATGNNIVVTKNIAATPKYGEVPNIEATDNVFYNSNDNQIDLNTLFKNPEAFGTWKIFIPIPDSNIDFGSGYGAEKRVLEMLENINLHESQKN